MIWYLLVALMIAMDQITKFFINKDIASESLNAVINNFLYITHVENRGISMSMLQNKRLMIISFTVFALIVMIYFLKKSNNTFMKLSLILITGGAVGNLIDRLLRGSVTDFLQFHLGSYISPIFNIADIFIIFGSIFLIYYLLIIQNKKSF